MKLVRIAILPLLLLCSCQSYDLGEEDPVEISVSTTNPVWSGEIQELVIAKCSSCHTANREDWVPANTPTTYDTIDDLTFFTNFRSTIENRIFNTPAAPMPPEFATPLTTNERAAIQAFINSL